jgi:hypothetical protein
VHTLVMSPSGNVTKITQFTKNTNSKPLKKITTIENQ